MRKRDWCFYIGDATTPEEVLSRHIASPSASPERRVGERRKRVVMVFPFVMRDSDRRRHPQEKPEGQP